MLQELSSSLFRMLAQVERRYVNFVEQGAHEAELYRWEALLGSADK